MRKMSRQNPERLNQRDQQHEKYHKRHHSQHLIALFGNEQKRGERDRRGNHTDHNGRNHPPGPGNRGIQSIFAALSLSHDVFSDDDCVVDHHTDQQKECKDRAKIDGQVRDIEEQQGSDKGNGDSHGDPDCDAKIKDHYQAQQHQNQADQAI